MVLSLKHFPEIIPDNEEVYIQHLKGVIESVDELCALQITKVPDSYHFRLSPSLPKYNNLLIEEILKFHNILKIRLDFSKSIKSSGTLVFRIAM